ncbi:TonB-dependent receptor [Paremcibacter congregatus]|uniref:TonB-dependent receptor n=1 Tax=Paremcibacter congregatus TaxID=2043170 RepID=UPI003A8E5BDA
MALGLGVFLTSTQAYAADQAAEQKVEQNDFTLEEVIVTARKRTETLQDVAVAVGVMNAERLSDAGIDSFLDAAIQMPGVSFLGTGEQRSTVVAVRGIGTSSNNIGVEPSTTLMLDGEVMVRSGAINADLTDLERLEVLRGPQSTLFGKNASAGVIHYISKRPNKNEMEGKVVLKIAEDNEYKINGVVSGPISDKVAFRMAAYYSYAGGYQKNNIVGNPNGGKYNSYGVRTQLLFTPSESLEILLRGEFSNKTTNCCASSTISVDEPDIMVRTSLTDPTQLVNVFELGKVEIGFDHGTTSLSKLQETTMENKAASIEVNKTIGDNTLTYQGYYRHWNSYGNIDPYSIGILSYPKYFAGTNDAKSTQHEIRLTSPGGETVDYVLGAVYFRSSAARVAEEQRCSRLDQGTVIDPDTLDILSCRSSFYVPQGNGKYKRNGSGSDRNYPTDTTFGPNQVVLYDFYNEYETDMVATNMALFGQLDYNVTDALKLSGGLRLLHENTRLEYRGGRSHIENWPDPALGEDNTTSETALIGKIAAQYNWNEDVMTYASYSRGYKGVGWFNIIAAQRDRLNSNPTNPDSGNGALDAERPEQFEVGIRSTWFDNRLTLNLTAFHIKNDKFQERVAELDDDPESPTFGRYLGDFRNIAIKSKGLEAELVARPARGWTVKASGAYVDATYQSGFQNCPPDRLGEANADVAADLASASLGQCFFDATNRSILSLKGMNLANSVKWQYRVSSSYSTEVSDNGDRVGFNVDYIWKDGQQSRSDQRLGSITDSYGIVNLAVNYRDADDAYKIEFFVKNAFNNHYYTRLVPQPGWLGGGYRGVTRRDFGRYIGAQATFNF